MRIPEIKKFEQQENTPQLLDVVKIDGRWAQVITEDAVKYLDNQQIEKINWQDYRFQPIKRKDCSECTRVWVNDLLEARQISSEEYNNLHWGPEQEKNPNLRDYITVFGEFKSLGN